MEKTMIAINTSKVKVSTKALKIGLPPSNGIAPLKAPNQRFSVPNEMIMKPQKVKKWAIPGMGSRKTPRWPSTMEIKWPMRLPI